MSLALASLSSPTSTGIAYLSVVDKAVDDGTATV